MASRKPVRGRADASKRDLGLITDPETSLRLGQIRQKGTSPELMVGALLRELGWQYRLVNRDLPGSPDFANRSARWAVFVHGCFWHAHENCYKATVPKRNRAFWLDKFASNRARDDRSAEALRALGYRVVVIWECELERPVSVSKRLSRAFAHIRENL